MDSDHVEEITHLYVAEVSHLYDKLEVLLDQYHFGALTEDKLLEETFDSIGDFLEYLD